MNKIKLWLRIIRPQTLFASICPVCIALIISGVRQPLIAVTTLLCALVLQILSNLINDYYDYLRGTDQKGRIGFKRALAEGEVNIKEMKCACICALLISIGTGLVLVIKGGWPILLIGVSAIIFAWLYTATSHSLSYLGIADLFVLLYYGLIAAAGTYYLQTGHCHSSVLFAGAVNGLISECVLMINNIRDIDTDRENGKRTLPVRFGRQTGEMILWIIVLLIPLLSWLAFGWSLTMLTVLPAAWLVCKVHRSHGAVLNKCLLAAGLTNLIYTVLAAI